MNKSTSIPTSLRTTAFHSQGSHSRGSNRDSNDDRDREIHLPALKSTEYLLERRLENVSPHKHHSKGYYTPSDKPQGDSESEQVPKLINQYASDQDSMSDSPSFKDKWYTKNSRRSGYVKKSSIDITLHNSYKSSENLLASPVKNKPVKANTTDRHKPERNLSLTRSVTGSAKVYNRKSSLTPIGLSTSKMFSPDTQAAPHQSQSNINKGQHLREIIIPVVTSLHSTSTNPT